MNRVEVVIDMRRRKRRTFEELVLENKKEAMRNF